MTAEVMLVTGAICLAALALVVGCCWLLAWLVNRELRDKSE